MTVRIDGGQSGSQLDDVERLDGQVADVEECLLPAMDS